MLSIGRSMSKRSPGRQSTNSEYSCKATNSRQLLKQCDGDSTTQTTVINNAWQQKARFNTRYVDYYFGPGTLTTFNRLFRVTKVAWARVSTVEILKAWYQKTLATIDNLNSRSETTCWHYYSLGSPRCTGVLHGCMIQRYSAKACVVIIANTQSQKSRPAAFITRSETELWVHTIYTFTS